MASARYLRRHRPGDDAGPGRHCLCSWHRACRASMVSTRRSSRCWPMRCSAPAAFWCWGRTPRSRPSSSPSSLRLSGGDPLRAVALASMMAIVSGSVCILAGVVRLGFVTELLSKPIRYGYMNGIALTVLISQLPKLFGFSIDERRAAAKPVGDRQRGPWRARPTGSTFVVGARHVGDDPAAQGQQALAGHSDRGRWRDASSSACSISAARYGVAVLGPLPQGLPAFRPPMDHLHRSRTRS